MKGTWWATVRGFVRVKLVGGDAEAFLNAATEEKISLWNISFANGRELTFGVTVPDYFKLRPLLRRCGSRTRILSRHGLPFRMAKLQRRKVFAGGMVAFVTALFVLSSLVWNVRVVGDDSAIPEQRIRQAALEEGLRAYQWSFRLPDTAVLSERIAKRLPEAAWVGVEKKGTSVVITVVDSTKPEQRPLEGPSNVIAKMDAVVTRIVAENGKPKVERNDRVKKGDMLISGILGEGNLRKAVSSKGTVMGLVWHEYRIVSPMEKTTRSYTGTEQTRSYFLIGNRALQISGYRGDAYEHSEVRSSMKRASLWKWKLPFGSMKEYEMEVLEESRNLTLQEAKEEGLAQARAEMLAKAGKGASVKAEKILHEHSENGKVMLTVLFEVEQSIGVERPIP